MAALCRLGAIVALLPVGLARGAAGGGGASHEVLLDDLSVRAVEVAGLSSAGVAVRGEGESVETIPMDRITGLWRRGPVPPAEEPPPGGTLELVDGQRWSGELSPGGSGTIVWTHPMMGRRVVSLDVLLRWRRGASHEPGGAPDEISDVVVLANGDRLEGFVVEIGEVVTVDAGNRPIEVPLDAVSSVRLANERSRPDGPVVWLRDGSVVRLAGLGEGGERMVVLRPLGLGGAGLSVPLEDVLAFAPSAGRLLPLHALGFDARAVPPGWSEGGRPVLEAREGVLGTRPLVIPEPMTLTWPLAEGARRFGAEVHLPREMWLWGDCELEVAWVSGGVRMELARVRLSADAPVHSLAVELPSRSDPGHAPRLELRLLEGRYGPIQDRVVIRRGLILLEE